MSVIHYYFAVCTNGYNMRLQVLRIVHLEEVNFENNLLKDALDPLSLLDF